jgi:hypothetical protein
MLLESVLLLITTMKVGIMKASVGRCAREVPTHAHPDEGSGHDQLKTDKQAVAEKQANQQRDRAREQRKLQAEDDRVVLLCRD